MADENMLGGATGAAPTTTTTLHDGKSLLDQAIGATRQTEPDQVEALLRALTDQALGGTVSFSKNLTVTMRSAIEAIDRQLSTQLAAIMHSEKFRALEGSWRGLHYLVMNSETGRDIKIRVINASKKDLSRDLEKAVEFDQSTLFKKIYENEFGTPGGEPYSALIGDYYFGAGQEDIELLRNVSSVAAAAFAPFISAAGPQMFGFENFEELSKPRDLAEKFQATEYAKWRSFRETDDARFVTLTMPRVLARQPFGAETKSVDEFNYEEAPVSVEGAPRAMGHDDYCWMNAAYAMGTKMTAAFSESGWTTAIRGAEGGGKVADLPTHQFVSDDGDLSEQCPTEIAITSRREKELSDLGFLPLSHYKNTDYAVFFGAQTTQKPKKYDRPEATENAAISARLPYIMASSRFAHYLKVMARDKIGSFMEIDDVSTWLNRWILNYVNAAEGGGQEIRAKFPLREGRVEVTAVPGAPGSYNAVAYLRPWLQMEELTASLRLVARIPQKS
ncbi:type VI secretion system contractile sheath large subunit [Sphingomonas montana]|uniref:type VI secretion system contractile sheath large subunit n=1 Tax=Sphingomonas montana TaxID=1843236 RepID=UPI0009FB7FA9|nr:type VI secretion system contractile sheath large subunit [Sphingomonas montana]